MGINKKGIFNMEKKYVLAKDTPTNRKGDKLFHTNRMSFGSGKKSRT